MGGKKSDESPILYIASHAEVSHATVGSSGVARQQQIEVSKQMTKDLANKKNEEARMGN